MRDYDIPDNYDLFRRHEDAQEAKLMRRPTCICCKDHIQDDFAYDFGYGPVCDDCVLDYIKSEFSFDIKD